MRALLLALVLVGHCLSAPIPPTRKPKAYHPKYVVGCKVRYWNYGMEIYKTDQKSVYIQTIKGKCRNFTGGDMMTYKELDDLLRECPQTFIPE